MVAELSKMKSPLESRLHSLQNWLKRGTNFHKDAGFELFPCTDKGTEAYVSLKLAYRETYVFSRFMMRVVARMFNRFAGQKMKISTAIDEEASLISYSESKLNRASNLVALIVSLGLYGQDNIHAQHCAVNKPSISLTILFTAVFVLLLAVFENAEGAEIFGALGT